MVQTVGQMTAKHATVEIKAVTSETWVDISGSAIAVIPGGGDHLLGDSHTFESAQALIALGKLNPLDWTLRGVYTEDDEEIVDLLHGFFENEERINLRYRPRPGWIWTSEGFIANPGAPEADGTSGDILTIEFNYHGTNLQLSRATT